MEHKFEAAGLGKAPFTYLGMEEKVFVACPGATPKAGGSCDYCGTGIRYVFYVRSACGKVSGVGCDCINKAGDAGMIKRVADAGKQFKRDAQRKIDDQKIAAAREQFALVAKELAKQPHPMLKDRTMADYVEWMLKNAGTSGRLKAAKIISGIAVAG